MPTICGSPCRTAPRTVQRCEPGRGAQGEQILVGVFVGVLLALDQVHAAPFGQQIGVDQIDAHRYHVGQHPLDDGGTDVGQVVLGQVALRPSVPRRPCPARPAAA